jgi:hypothetical protein
MPAGSRAVGDSKIRLHIHGDIVVNHIAFRLGIRDIKW